MGGASETDGGSAADEFVVRVDGIRS